MGLSVVVIDPAGSLTESVRAILPRDAWLIEVPDLADALAYVQAIRLDLIVSEDDGTRGVTLVTTLRADRREVVRRISVLLIAQSGSPLLAPRQASLGATACVDARLWPEAGGEALRVLLPRPGG